MTTVTREWPAVEPEVLIIDQPTPGHEGLVAMYHGPEDLCGTKYIVTAIQGGVEFRRMHSEGGQTYLTHHSRGVPQKCTCADAKYRPARVGGCKHQRALAALLAKW